MEKVFNAIVDFIKTNELEENVIKIERYGNGTIEQLKSNEWGIMLAYTDEEVREIGDYEFEDMFIDYDEEMNEKYKEDGIAFDTEEADPAVGQAYVKVTYTPKERTQA